MLIKVEAETHDAEVAAIGTKLIAYAFFAFSASEAETLEDAQDVEITVGMFIAHEAVFA